MQDKFKDCGFALRQMGREGKQMVANCFVYRRRASRMKICHLLRRKVRLRLDEVVCWIHSAGSLPHEQTARTEHDEDGGRPSCGEGAPGDD
ncbi:unnamed protein product [Protopolystoma xenopodis]|uniref:Uncharacterized protein n=1 Tax=Protopolystoma xenopodis TaxID=117903 RepID=A0A3S5AKZ6_9PLAT|nr:unnamed protein product [Protopolystoma xenopodis]